METTVYNEHFFDSVAKHFLITATGNMNYVISMKKRNSVSLFLTFIAMFVV